MSTQQQPEQSETTPKQALDHIYAMAYMAPTKEAAGPYVQNLNNAHAIVTTAFIKMEALEAEIKTEVSKIGKSGKPVLKAVTSTKGNGKVK